MDTNGEQEHKQPEEEPKVTNGDAEPADDPPKPEPPVESQPTIDGIESITPRPGPQEEDPAEDPTNDGELSPPPDSSSVSSVNPDMLGDEIVVGDGKDESPRRENLEPEPEPEDEQMPDAEDGEPVASHYPKRKRPSLYNHLAEDKIEGGGDALKDEDAETAVRRGGSKPRPALKGAIIGHWRDSSVPEDEHKHAVIGFMDIRDRLRTRIQTIDRAGQPISLRDYAIPPGPGGSWVTFERIVFDDHLVGLDHNEIKEWVKAREEGYNPEDPPETKKRLDDEAVQEAKRRLAANPPTETPVPPAIAWGKVIPDDALLTRPEKRRRINGQSLGGTTDGKPRSAGTPTSASTANTAFFPQNTPTHPPDALPGTRPTRILIGCWSKSDAENDKDKHAVYGILGANDMFRVKLVRETLDGRYMDANFPTGAGALWIAYEEVLFLPHIRGLSRPEMKEYVRVRQSQLDAGENESTRVANETKAVFEAQSRAATLPRNNAAAQQNTPSLAPRHALPGAPGESPDMPKIETRALEHRHGRRELPSPHVGTRGPRHSLPDPSVQQQQGGGSDVERQRGIVGRAMDRMEANQVRDDRYAAQRAVQQQQQPPQASAREDFDQNLHRMQKVWAAQETNRARPAPGGIGASTDDSKIHQGVKYERRQNGPLAGKLVSQGALISIDGEDYVEYRVLTKPSFF